MNFLKMIKCKKKDWLEVLRTSNNIVEKSIKKERG